MYRKPNNIKERAIAIVGGNKGKTNTDQKPNLDPITNNTIEAGGITVYQRQIGS